MLDKIKNLKPGEEVIYFESNDTHLNLALAKNYDKDLRDMANAIRNLDTVHLFQRKTDKGFQYVARGK